MEMNASKAKGTQNLEKAAPKTAAPWERKFNWQCGYAVNMSGNRNKQYTGLEPGYVMTIISYKNIKVFW